MHYVILFSVLLLSALPGYAQRDSCKTKLIHHAALLKAESMAINNRQLHDNKLIRVYFRVFRNNNGSNVAASLADINMEFAQLQVAYQNKNICFANMGMDYINNTDLNIGIDLDEIATYQDLFQFVIPDCITIFYHANLTDAGGTAYSIPNTFLSVQRDNIGAMNTLAHEVGHCLGLLHTHETAYGFGYINGSECTQNGDRVCDTPADPWSFNGILPCFSNNNCMYTGNCTDPNGGSLYSPPYSNIMSYWGSAGCVVNDFTDGQITRAHTFLFADENLQAIQSPGTLSYGPATHSSGLLLKSAINSFTTSGQVMLSNSNTANIQANEIILLPGFTAAPTSGQVTIKPVSCIY